MGHGQVEQTAAITVGGVVEGFLLIRSQFCLVVAVDIF